MSGPSITAEQVRASKWRFLCHLNMGRAGHTMVHSCVDFPRLVVSRHTVRGKGTQTLTVDGVEVVDLAAAVQALNAAPAPIETPPQTALQLDLGFGPRT